MYIPALIIYINNTAYIIDTQISIETINTDINYTIKTNYYNTTDIIAYDKKITGANRILFSGSCWNWCGIPSALTTEYLRFVYTLPCRLTSTPGLNYSRTEYSSWKVLLPNTGQLVSVSVGNNNNKFI